MDRFFNSKNIHRYRKLTGSMIKASERKRILELLVNEIAAFKDECRAPVPRKSDYFSGNANDSVCATPVYLAGFDDQSVSALLVDASPKVEPRLSELFREWREKEHIPDTISSISSVSLECEITFIDHEGERVRCTQLIVLEDTREGSRFSRDRPSRSRSA
jgi:hypothetical protein